MIAVLVDAALAGFVLGVFGMAAAMCASRADWRQDALALADAERRREALNEIRLRSYDAQMRRPRGIR